MYWQQAFSFNAEYEMKSFLLPKTYYMRFIWMFSFNTEFTREFRETRYLLVWTNSFLSYGLKGVKNGLLPYYPTAQKLNFPNTLITQTAHLNSRYQNRRWVLTGIYEIYIDLIYLPSTYLTHIFFALHTFKDMNR